MAQPFSKSPESGASTSAESSTPSSGGEASPPAPECNVVREGAREGRIEHRGESSASNELANAGAAVRPGTSTELARNDTKSKNCREQKNSGQIQKRRNTKTSNKSSSRNETRRRRRRDGQKIRKPIQVDTAAELGTNGCERDNHRKKNAIELSREYTVICMDLTEDTELKLESAWFLEGQYCSYCNKIPNNPPGFPSEYCLRCNRRL